MKEKIQELINQFIKDYSKTKDVETRWKEPLAAYADADDNMFYELKSIISPTHALPWDFLPEAATVVAYFIPFDESIVKSNVEGKESSRVWARAYIETNRLIGEINVYMKDYLERLGYKTAIFPATHNFDEKKLISDWSHRHAAYIAGLGKFGINNMLITEKGCCGKCLVNVPCSYVNPVKKK